MKAERETSRCRSAKNNLIELINNSLYLCNLIIECSQGKFPQVKALEQQSKQELMHREKLIGGIHSLTWETFWFFLVKPHSQQMAMMCLTDAINHMIPEFVDATFAAQLHSCMSQPLEVQPMLAICQLRSQEDQSI